MSDVVFGVFERSTRRAGPDGSTLSVSATRRAAPGVAARGGLGHTDSVASPDSDLIADFAAAVRQRIVTDVEREEREASARRAAMLARLGPAVEAARSATDAGRVWLFGSYAWGYPDAQSDVDLLVENLRAPDLFAYLVSKACDVQVHAVSLEGAPATLVERATFEGMLL